MSRGRKQRTLQRQRSQPEPAQAGPEPLPPTGGYRLLVLGDTAGTGFGTVTRDLSRAMVRRGLDVRILSMNEDAGFMIDPAWPRELVNRTMLLGTPSGWAGMSGPEAAELVQRALGIFTGQSIPSWLPEAVLIIGDHASVEGSPWLKLIPEQLPVYNYVPIEGVDLPPSWAKLWQRAKPVAMTRFGADEIAKLGLPRPPVVYHGVDPEAFHPATPSTPLSIKLRDGIKLLRSKADCRRFLGWPEDAVIMFRADRLMPRKAYPAMFRSLAPVLARHPKLVMYLHCRSVDQGGNLWHESSKYPDFIRSRMGLTGFHDREGGVPRELLTVMYNAADIYISTSAEGFGLTVAEALACGTPAVALGYSSLPEVVGPAGILVNEYALIDNIYSYFWAIPKGDGYSEAVEKLVVDAELRRRLGSLGPAHVAQFSWEVAAEQFEAILAGAEAPAPKPVPLGRRLAALGMLEARG